MHPFWAVRRITDAALRREKTIGNTESVPDFNCKIVNKVHTVVDIATVGDQNLTSTRLITVPYITNVKDVLEGEELIVRHYPRATIKKASKPNWRDVGKEEEAQAKKKAKQQKK